MTDEEKAKEYASEKCIDSMFNSLKEKGYVEVETQDAPRYKIGDISQTTGLQKTANGWVKPKGQGGSSEKKFESKPLKQKINELEDIGFGEVKNPIPMADRSVILGASAKLNEARKRNSEKYEEKIVNVDDLTTRQDWVDKEKLEDFEKGWDESKYRGDKIRAVEFDGHLVLIDGNHRSAIAKLKGEKNIKIDLLK